MNWERDRVFFFFFNLDNTTYGERALVRIVCRSASCRSEHGCRLLLPVSLSVEFRCLKLQTENYFSGYPDPLPLLWNLLCASNVCVRHRKDISNTKLTLTVHVSYLLTCRFIGKNCHHIFLSHALYFFALYSFICFIILSLLSGSIDGAKNIQSEWYSSSSFRIFPFMYMMLKSKCSTNALWPCTFTQCERKI